MKRTLSGIKPTGRPHLGNYIAMLKPIISHLAQDADETFLMIADYHAITNYIEPSVLHSLTNELLIDLGALIAHEEKLSGKKNIILYKQSSISEHTELNWIFNCQVTVPYLMRAHAFKDAEAKKKEISVGVFDYPVLMAADILIYDPEFIPVGFDQKQHVEYARDIAQKFNSTYGETFVLPKEFLILGETMLPGFDGQKMSKSYGNILPLFSERKDIEELVMGIPTDSRAKEEPKDPTSVLLYKFFSFINPDDVNETTSFVKNGLEKGGLGYGEVKKILIETIDTALAPLRDTRKEIAANPQGIIKRLEEGTVIARERAFQKMADVRKKIGIV